MCAYTRICMYMYIYIYIYRERETLHTIRVLISDLRPSRVGIVRIELMITDRTRMHVFRDAAC